MSHQTIPLRPPGAPKGVTVGIDVGIAGLIKALWKADIHTVNSCQDRADEAIPKPGISWIQFASAGDFETFLDAVQGDDIDHEQWQVDYLLDDMAKSSMHYDHRVSVSVRFPFAITGELTRRINGYVAFITQEKAA